MSDNFSSDKMQNWQHKILLANLGRKADYDNDDADRDNLNIERTKLTSQLYSQMTSEVLRCITELYELEYKKHLIITSYQNLLPENFTTIYQINGKLSQLADFLRNFILTNILLIQTTHTDPENDNGINPTWVNLLDLKKETIVSQFFSSFYDKGMRSGPLYPDHTTAYLWDMWTIGSDTHTAYVKMFSKDIATKLVGLTSMFNIVHDDSRHLVIGSGNEEYPELLIPRAQYERASRINHRKVERELKQELVGY